MTTPLVLLLTTLTLSALATNTNTNTNTVPCDTPDVRCLTPAACAATSGEIQPRGLCTRKTAVCCAVGVMQQQQPLQKKSKRQFGFITNVINTINNVKMVVNGVNMLATGLNTLNNAANAANNAANAANMLANAIPTGLPSLPPAPTLPPVPSYTVPPIPTVPAFTLPVTAPTAVPTLPKPNTNPRSGLPIGVDPNNPNGFATNAAGQFINEFNVPVDRYGMPIQYMATNAPYVAAPTVPFVQPPTAPANNVPNVVPGGNVNVGADQNGDEQQQATTAAKSDGLPVGAYVGIGVVSFLCLMLLCVVVFCVATRSRNSDLEYNVKNSAYDPSQSAASPWGAPANSQFGSFNNANNFAAGGSFNGGAANFNNNNSGMMYDPSAQTTMMLATDLPSPSGALRSANTDYALQQHQAPTSTQLVGGTMSGAQATYVCDQCGKSYFYQNDLTSHKAARHDVNGF